MYLHAESKAICKRSIVSNFLQLWQQLKSKRKGMMGRVEWYRTFFIDFWRHYDDNQVCFYKPNSKNRRICQPLHGAHAQKSFRFQKITETLEMNIY